MEIMQAMEVVQNFQHVQKLMHGLVVIILLSCHVRIVMFLNCFGNCTTIYVFISFNLMNLSLIDLAKYLINFEVKGSTSIAKSSISIEHCAS